MISLVAGTYFYCLSGWYKNKLHQRPGVFVKAYKTRADCDYWKNWFLNSPGAKKYKYVSADCKVVYYCTEIFDFPTLERVDND